MFIFVHTHVYEKNGWAALHYASKGGSADVAEVLVKNGARVEMQNKVNYMYVDYTSVVMTWNTKLAGFSDSTLCCK